MELLPLFVRGFPAGVAALAAGVYAGVSVWWWRERGLRAAWTAATVTVGAMLTPVALLGSWPLEEAIWALSCGAWMWVAMGKPESLKAMMGYGWGLLLLCAGWAVVGLLAGAWGGTAVGNAMLVAVSSVLPLLVGGRIAAKRPAAAGAWLVLSGVVAGGVLQGWVLHLGDSPRDLPHALAWHGVVTLPLLATAVYCLRRRPKADSPTPTP